MRNSDFTRVIQGAALLPLAVLAACTQSASSNDAAQSPKQDAARSKAVAAYNEAFNCYRAFSHMEVVLGTTEDPHIWKTDRATIEAKKAAAEEKFKQVATAAGKTYMDVTIDESNLLKNEKWDPETHKIRAAEAETCAR